MSTFLFLTQPTMGHLNPLLTIALELQAAGHSVRFVVPGRPGINTPLAVFKTAQAVPVAINGQGLPVDLVPAPWPATLLAPILPLTTDYVETLLALEIFLAGLPEYTRAVLQLLDRYAPDLLVSDFSFLAGHCAGELAQVPCAVIYHSGLPFRGAWIPPFGSGLPIGPGAAQAHPGYARAEALALRRVDQRVNRARRQLGLDAFPSGFFRQPYSHWLNIITSHPAWEAPRDDLPGNTVFAGPCFSHRRGSHPGFPWDGLRPDRYKVYVSLGTVFNNRPAVFRTVLEALAGAEYQVIVSAGGAYAALQRSGVPANAWLFPSVPQLDLLPKVDLVIGHGGNNSTNETLAAGKPLLILPIGGEQGDNARRVEYLGVGRRLDRRRLSVDYIRQEVAAVRGNPAYAAQAQLLAAMLGQTDGAQVAAAHLTALLSGSRS